MVQTSNMQIPVSDAKSQLTELIRRAEAGEDIVLSRHGKPIVRLVPVTRKLTREQRRAVLDEIRASAASKAAKGQTAARSQDFLYDEEGLPK
jgi:prevent-host-death family protein